MPLRTLHKDSCLNLKALAEHNRIISKNNGVIEEDFPDEDDNIDSSSIIDLKLVGSKTSDELNTETPTETSVSSNSSNSSIDGSIDTAMNSMQNEHDSDGKFGNNKKVMARLFPWLKNKENNNSKDEQSLADGSAASAAEEKKEEADNPISPAKDLQNTPTTGRNLKRTISPFPEEETNSAAPNLRKSSFSEEKSEPVQKSIMKKKKHKVKKNVTFSTTARLITIYPHKDLPPYLKRQIWWQRADYKNFKKTIDIISRELIQHASDDVWFLGAQDHRFVSPTERSEENEFGAKWWCQYGHSRRGLEHICSMAEGRFRQQNVERAMTCTLIEQERQNLSENPDMRKLGMAAFRFTAFARDLARAVGKADAEAVRVNFEAQKIKDFRYYMPSKYDKGFEEWDRSENRETLTADSMKDVFAERTAVVVDEHMSELDSFNDNPTFP